MSTVTQMIPLNQRVMVLWAGTFYPENPDEKVNCYSITEPALGIALCEDSPGNGNWLDYIIQPTCWPDDIPLGGMTNTPVTVTRWDEMERLNKDAGPSEWVAVTCLWPEAEDAKRLAPAIAKLNRHVVERAEEHRPVKLSARKKPTA